MRHKRSTASILEAALYLGSPSGLNILCRKEMVSDFVYPLFLICASALESPRVSRKPGRGEREAPLGRDDRIEASDEALVRLSQLRERLPGSRTRSMDCRWALFVAPISIGSSDSNGHSNIRGRFTY